MNYELIYFIIKHTFLYIYEIKALQKILPTTNYLLVNNFYNNDKLFYTPDNFNSYILNIYNIEIFLYILELFWLIFFNRSRKDVPTQKRKKFNKSNTLMISHHIVTIILIHFFGKNYLQGYSFLIMILHNQADIFLNILKLFFSIDKPASKNYLNNLVEFTMCSSFIISWSYTRLYILPTIIYTFYNNFDFFIKQNIVPGFILLNLIQIFQLIWTYQIYYYSKKKLTSNKIE